MLLARLAERALEARWAMPSLVYLHAARKDPPSPYDYRPLRDYHRGALSEPTWGLGNMVN